MLLCRRTPCRGYAAITYDTSYGTIHAAIDVCHRPRADLRRAIYVGMLLPHGRVIIFADATFYTRVYAPLHCQIAPRCHMLHYYAIHSATQRYAGVAVSCHALRQLAVT